MMGPFIHISFETISFIIDLAIFVLLAPIGMAVRKKIIQKDALISKLNQEIAQNKQQYQEIFDNIDVAIWSVDKRTNKWTVSDRFMKMSGHKLEEFNHNPNLWQEMIYVEDAPLIASFMEKADSGQSSIFEHRITLQSGEIRWVHCLCTPVLDQAGNVIRINGVLLDITEKRQAQEELDTNRALLEKITDSVDVAIWSYDCVMQKVEYTSEGVATVSGYPVEKFVDRNAWRELVHPEDAAIFEQLSAQVKQGRPAVSEYRIIHANGEIRWVQVRIIPTVDKTHNIRRFDGVVIDITTQHSMKEALNRSEQRYKSLFQYNSDVICEMDLDGNIVAINSVAEGITGQPFVDANNKVSWVDVFGDNNVERIAEYFHKAKLGYSQTYELTSAYKNGNVVEWEIKQVPIYVNDDIVGVFSICRDITSKKEIEKALAESEAMYRLIAENMTDMVRIVDINGESIYASPSHTRLLGYSPEEYIEKQMFYSMIHPDDLKIVEREFNELLASGSPRQADFRVIHANGQTRYLEELATPVFGDDGQIELFVFHSRDVTEKRAAEQAVQESESKYRLIAENMADILGVVDKEGRIRYTSPSYKRVLGYDDQSMVGTSAFAYIHPDDVEYVQNSLKQLIQTGTDTPARFRLMHAGGYPIFVDCLSTPVDAEDGSIDSIVVVARDITEKVQIEQELRESEERYRRLMELSPQPMVTHRNEFFTYINPAGVQLLGAADASEIIGTRIYDIVHPDYLEIARDRTQSVAEKKYLGTVEFKMIRGDGRVFEAETTGSYDEKTQSTLVTFNDVTERNKMERALQDSEERYRRLVELSPVAIAVHKDNKFIYVNPAALTVVGATNLEDVIGMGPLDLVHPDHLELATERMKTTYQKGFCANGQYQIIRLDGQVIDISVTAIYDSQSSSVQLVFEDITARIEAERALLESEELNRKLVELSPEAIVFHCDYKFNYVNPAGIEFFGASSLNDLVGKSIFENIHPDCHDTSTRRVVGVYEEQKTTDLSEVKLLRLDGTTVDAEVIVTPIPFRGKNAGLSLVRDITKRKKAEAERKQAELLVRESEDRYFRLQTSLDLFSHDLFGIMKVDEMERRLIKEVRKIMKATNISLIEVGRNGEVFVKHGNPSISDSLLEEIMLLRHLPVCEAIDTQSDFLLKLGEKKGRSYLLCVSDKPPTFEVTPKRVWLNTLSRYVSVLYDNFRLIEDLTKELEEIASQQVAPPWLIRLLFNLSENERKNLSQDLHDAALQEQIIWYRKLDQISTDPSLPDNVREQLQLITQGLLDVIYQIRITCNELRPPMLKEEGLVSSLEALFELTQIRTNYYIQFNAADFHHTLNDDLLIGLYRIVQELLANAAKHSDATGVHITLSSDTDRIQLVYEDNGIGMDLNHMRDSFKSMGVYGMKERVRSMDGTIEFHSSPNNGLSIFISIPAVSVV